MDVLDVCVLIIGTLCVAIPNLSGLRGRVPIRGGE